MPCTVTGSLEGDRELEAEEARGAATRTTDMLCRTLSALPVSTIEGLPADVQAWWRNHQAMDAARAERERAIQSENEARDRKEYERLRTKLFR